MHGEGKRRRRRRSSLLRARRVLPAALRLVALIAIGQRSKPPGFAGTTALAPSRRFNPMSRAPRNVPKRRPKPVKLAQAKRGLGSIADPVALARETLEAICRDFEAPAAARAQSARTLLELAGVLKTGASSAPKIGAEMTLEEIDARLADIAPDTGADTH
jgi:hypothetical protein